MANPFANPRAHVNTERFGTRDLSLSRNVRAIVGVRHLDLDLYQYCPLTGRIEIVFEASASELKATYMTQSIAKQLGCVMMHVRHHTHDLDGVLPVDIYLYHPDGRLIHSAEGISWDDFRQVCLDIHENFGNLVSL